jgi:HAD superfamily hydrolase (TIGR01459 family)
MLSNAPRRAASLIDLMTEIGLPRHLYGEVMSSGEAVNRELDRRSDPWFAALGRRCFHLGPPRDHNIFDGLDLIRVPAVDDADFILNTGPVTFDETFDVYVPLLEQAAARRLPMICANPDVVVVHRGRRHFCAGALAQHYEGLGGPVRWRGKPDPAIYDICLGLLGVSDRGRVLAIGDGLATDGAGARAAGLDFLLCTGGIHAEEIGTAYGEIPDPARLGEVIARHGDLRPIAAIGGLAW